MERTRSTHSNCLWFQMIGVEAHSPRAPEPRVLEDCKQLASVGLRAGISAAGDFGTSSQSGRFNKAVLSLA
jgi:hypothetical protein